MAYPGFLAKISARGEGGPICQSTSDPVKFSAFSTVAVAVAVAVRKN